MVGQSGGKEIDGDIMAVLPLIAGSFHLQPGQDIFAVGSEPNGHGSHFGGHVVDVGDGLGVDESVLSGKIDT